LVCSKGGYILAHLMKANTKPSRWTVQGILKDTKKKMENMLSLEIKIVDTEKTRLNYNLAEDKISLNFIKKRTSEIKMR